MNTNTQKKKYHIQFAISGHGFGHVAQCAPVIDELTSQHPEIKISVRSEAPEYKLRERLGASVELQHAHLDIGMIQRDALSIDAEKSYQAYCEFHKNWQEKVKLEADSLASQNIDLVVANAPYLSLAAAGQANIPCIGFCSLNWAEIYAHFFKHKNEKILNEILHAYEEADFFICPEPSMPMPNIKNRVDVGPVAQLYQDYVPRPEINPSSKLILISMGGMDLQIEVGKWQAVEGLHIILPDNQPFHDTEKFSTLASLGLNYQEALQLCDVLVTKPGYGSFVEAAIQGKPIISLPRKNWPEAKLLLSWYKNSMNCTEISVEEFNTGSFLENIRETITPSKQIYPSGNLESAAAIYDFIVN